MNKIFLAALLWGGLALAQPGLESNTIEARRARSYPGSAITIERTLAQGANYRRYLASYRSDGLKIYALLTVPGGSKPASGWPAIVFNHGYIPPQQYRVNGRIKVDMGGESLLDRSGVEVTARLKRRL